MRSGVGGGTSGTVPLPIDELKCLRSVLETLVSKGDCLQSGTCGVKVKSEKKSIKNTNLWRDTRAAIGYR